MAAAAVVLVAVVRWILYTYVMYIHNSYKKRYMELENCVFVCYTSNLSYHRNPVESLADLKKDSNQDSPSRCLDNNLKVQAEGQTAK